MAHLQLLQQNNISGKAFIWVHAPNEKNTQLHLKAAQAGVWLEFDGISNSNIAEYVQLLQTMKVAGLLKQILISQGAGWYHVGEAQGGEFRG